jgi:DNA-binding NtrC family response regulator
MAKITARSSGEEQRLLKARTKEGCGLEVQFLGGPPISTASVPNSHSDGSGVAPVLADHGAIHTAILESLIVLLASKEGGPFELDRILTELERGAIQLAMAATGDSGTQAALVLGVNRPTLVEKRRRLGLPLKLRKVKGARD